MLSSDNKHQNVRSRVSSSIGSPLGCSGVLTLAKELSILKTNQKQGLITKTYESAVNGTGLEVRISIRLVGVDSFTALASWEGASAMTPMASISSKALGWSPSVEKVLNWNWGPAHRGRKWGSCVQTSKFDSHGVGEDTRSGESRVEIDGTFVSSGGHMMCRHTSHSLTAVTSTASCFDWMPSLYWV